MRALKIEKLSFSVLLSLFSITRSGAIVEIWFQGYSRWYVLSIIKKGSAQARFFSPPAIGAMFAEGRGGQFDFMHS